MAALSSMDSSGICDDALPLLYKKQKVLDEFQLHPCHPKCPKSDDALKPTVDIDGVQGNQSIDSSRRIFL
jgi:hypothetical protein